MNQIRHNWDLYVSNGFGEKKVFKKNKVLFHQGETGKGFYYLTEGEVKISVISNEGHERTIDYVRQGELLGEQGFMNNSYATTAKTTTSSTLYFFSNQTFNSLCSEIPEASIMFTNSLILKVRLLAESIVIINAPAEYRLAHFLYKLYRKTGGHNLKMSQIALGHYIGTSRITIYKILKQLEEKGIIELKNGDIQLLNIQKLESMINLFFHSSANSEIQKINN
ncbi:cAMP-binding protein [Schinkia azotoformans MEV2011]|uniref:cAMP-binding protein n=1 Tax=Schinkia azotoformans MEV2011 TaxID=1348973 RepID=A0A072NHI1_SCHAZ|nr:Crp/Fnr family transcriptional regulator [Schinkia azotoformans]KEF36986.1 cAMP-binding protein [Schinkia azotoformans MEV2011]MEC1694417.1 Crp/Fnr family transcriptional regulator [Schinkia azotoformans]MEC1714456.1 Crp/Fnr family transcriptional regulator [Schinkia azotoformans]MEC1723228.1 Crp/Fnr family transcriptional regulator [Schinkia azotoformans]MEC1740449.1 Crp/Fnr family transcriptional regulator [Schinkia azotoformans]